jgi:hypothetical protein
LLRNVPAAFELKGDSSLRRSASAKRIASHLTYRMHDQPHAHSWQDAGKEITMSAGPANIL